MKNYGSKSKYYHERIADLLRAYTQCIAGVSYIYLPDIYRRVVEMPATRFWVSEHRAAVVVAEIMRGDNLHYMRKNKREMFFEIFRRVEALKEEYPADRPLLHLVEEVVFQPAPKFYLCPGSARALILKGKKQWRIEKLLRRSV